MATSTAEARTRTSTRPSNRATAPSRIFAPAVVTAVDVRRRRLGASQKNQWRRRASASPPSPLLVRAPTPPIDSRARSTRLSTCGGGGPSRSSDVGSMRRRASSSFERARLPLVASSPSRGVFAFSRASRYRLFCNAACLHTHLNLLWSTEIILLLISLVSIRNSI